MIFLETGIKGLFVLEIDKKEDFRGFFARSWCAQEMKDHGLNPKIVQANISFNLKRGTFRGIHFQNKPFQESKLVRCSKGAVFDIAVDLRKDSPTFKKWLGFELSAQNHRMLYIPENFGHGFITLKNNTEVNYLVSQFYHPEAESGFRWNDAQFDIKLPLEVSCILDRDKNFPDFDECSI
ncbi:MAG: dTDP-4-dehydrorhamnose 3,5-epimerase [Bacteroidales bacterium]